MKSSQEEPGGKLVRNKPHGLLRWLLRFPIGLYHLHLGWLLGKRFLLLTHTGRKSGLQRETVIEVVRYDRNSGICIVASGWGTKSDWFRNILKKPQVTIQLGTRKWKATVHVLSQEEGSRELFSYSQRYPAAFREISKVMTGDPIPATEENCHRLAEMIPLVAFHPDILE